MIHYYYIDVDTKKTAVDYQYFFNTEEEAEKAYDSMKEVAYKSLKYYDDEKGDVLVKSEFYGY